MEMARNSLLHRGEQHRKVISQKFVDDLVAEAGVHDIHTYDNDQYERVIRGGDASYWR